MEIVFILRDWDYTATLSRLGEAWESNSSNGIERAIFNARELAQQSWCRPLAGLCFNYVAIREWWAQGAS